MQIRLAAASTLKTLTDEIEAGAGRTSNEIEALGGTLAAIEKGFHPERDSKLRL